MRIGEYLKQQRLLRHMDLEYVARITRIPSRWLIDIEQGNFTALPGKTFVRGYVKAYASCIGLDANDVILRLDDEFANPDTTR